MGELAKWLRTLTALAEDPDLVPCTHTGWFPFYSNSKSRESESVPMSVPVSSNCTQVVHINSCSLSHIHIKINNSSFKWKKENSEKNGHWRIMQREESGEGNWEEAERKRKTGAGGQRADEEGFQGAVCIYSVLTWSLLEVFNVFSLLLLFLFFFILASCLIFLCFL